MKTKVRREIHIGDSDQHKSTGEFDKPAKTVLSVWCKMKLRDDC